MLDQHWLGDINDSTDNDLNAAALTNVRLLKRFAPTPVEQRSDSGHARCWRRTLGPGDASQDPDAHRGVSTRQWSADLFRGNYLRGGSTPSCWRRHQIRVRVRRGENAEII